MSVKASAEGRFIIDNPGLHGIKMRVGQRPLEDLDPFAHGGYQPEPVSDPVVEIDMLEELRKITRKRIVEP
jgi:hypothetical protein